MSRLNSSPPTEPDRHLWESVWEKSTVERPVQKQILAALESVVDIRGLSILEVGCGSAVNSIELAKRGGCAFALDYSLHALRKAQEYCIQHGVDLPLIAGDVFHLPFADDCFDIVFSQGLMEHFTNPLESIYEQVRVTRPGGYICIDVPQTWNFLTLYKRWHIRRGTWFAGWETDYSLPKLEKLMKQAGLEIVSSYGWLYFPSVAYGIRNLHTLNERRRLPIWLNEKGKKQIEGIWSWLESRRWYYRWLGCIGVIGRKV